MRTVAACLAVAVAAVVVVAQPSRAHACSCGLPADAVPETHPADGDVDVPTNAQVLVVGQFGPSGISIHDAATGDAVDIEIAQWQRFGGLDLWHLAIPIVELASNTEYEIRSDGEPTARFTTGAGPDTAPPAYAGITSLALDRLESREPCSSGVCWDGDPLERLVVDYPPPPADTMLTLLNVRDADTGNLVMELPIRPGSPITGTILSQHSCTDDPPPIDPDTAYCAEIVVVDQAGNRAGEGVQVCSEARTCQIARCEDAFDVGCEPPRDSSGCAAATPPTDGAGPALVMLCLFGLVLARRRRL